jgi:hypothetical protein
MEVGKSNAYVDLYKNDSVIKNCVLRIRVYWKKHEKNTAKLGCAPEVSRAASHAVNLLIELAPMCHLNALGILS